MTIIDQRNTDLFELLKSGKAIVILDNDGTIFDSQPAEAWRIQTLLAEFGEENIPPHDAILEMGYGQKIWADKLVIKLKEQYPWLLAESLSQLEERLRNGPVDQVIVEMGQHMHSLPGAKHFLHEMLFNGNTVAICSDNYADAVAEAINFHFEGIHCPLPDNRLAHVCASKKTPKQNDRLISSLNDKKGRDLKRKPDPTKLLIQQFKALLNLNIVQDNREQLDSFLTDTEFRLSLKSHRDYQKTVYIGDDVKDYLAADNAHFDYFVAVTTTGKCNESQFLSEIESNPSPSNIQVLLVSNLEMLRDLIQRCGSIKIDSLANSVGFFAAQGSAITPSAPTNTPEMNRAMVVNPHALGGIS